GPSRFQLSPCLVGGAKRDRTADLYNAIVALSQLSYGPEFLWSGRWAGRPFNRAPTYERGTRLSSEKQGLALVALFHLLDHLGHIDIVLAALRGIRQNLLRLITFHLKISFGGFGFRRGLRCRLL